MRIVLVDETDSFDLAPVQRDLSRLDVGLDVQPVPRIQADDGEPEAWLDWMAWHTAFAKVRDLQAPAPQREPADLEVEKERRALGGDSTPPGPLYDGVRLIEAFHGVLPDGLASPLGPPVAILTDRLVGTFEGGRYHVRFFVGGHPCIVSPPGFVDGPARDRSFYLAKQMLGSAHDADAISEDDHLTRGDERISRCVASALLQVLAYHETGDPFCEQEACRLYNPHWQEELLASMTTEHLCEEHANCFGARREAHTSQARGQLDDGDR